jgi:outer membrane protein assembly factor BamB
MNRLQMTVASVAQRAGGALALMFVLSACGGGGEPAPTAFPGLSVADDAAYLASNQHVFKFDPASGREVWRYPQVGQTFETSAAPGPFAGEPLKLGDNVIVGGAIPFNGVPDATIYALSDTNGQVVWRWSVPGNEQQRREFADGVATDGKLIFAANGNGTLYALDPAKIENNAPKVVWERSAGNKLWSRPLVNDGVVYQSSLDHTLSAYTAADGKPLWAQPFKAGASIASTPVIQNGTLYVGSFDGKFYAVDAKTGAKKWATEVGAWIWTRAALSEDTVFFGDTKGRFHALALDTGAVRYSVDLGGSIHAQPIIADGNVYVASSDASAPNLFVLPLKGAAGAVTPARFSEAGFNRRLLTTPALQGGRLLVPLFDGDVKLSAYSLKDKAKTFDLTLPTATPPPAK